MRFRQVFSSVVVMALTRDRGVDDNECWRRLGVRIRAALDRADMTPAEAADLIRMSQSTMSRTVRGLRKVKVGELAKIAYVCGLPAGALLEDVE